MKISRKSLKMIIENYLKEEVKLSYKNYYAPSVTKLIDDMLAGNDEFINDNSIYIEFSTESVVQPGVSKLRIKSASGKTYFEFDAVSGHKSYFGKDPIKTMSIKSYSRTDAKKEKVSDSAVAGGPTPEGEYTLGEMETQGNSGLLSTYKNKLYVLLGKRDSEALAYFGQKTPVSKIAWGNFRYSLTPSSDNEMFLRNELYIHGGAEAGSGGCIDLTGEMDGFTTIIELWRKNNSNPIKVIVDYPPLGQSTDYSLDSEGESIISTDNVEDYN